MSLVYIQSSLIQLFGLLVYTRSYIKMENLNKYGKVQHGNGREKGLCGNNLNLIRYHSQFLQEMKGQDNLDT